MELRELLQNPSCFSQNRLTAHSDHTTCYAQEEHPRIILLDGKWKFRYYADLPERNTEFARNAQVSSDWEEISVPAHINLSGYGEPPQYVDTAYPWDGKEQIIPGELPKEIPVGQYVKSFQLPDNWAGESVRIRFEGVEPAFTVFCNGERIGYSEDSFTPTEFDLSRHLRPGENLLAVEVYRWASGSWLEDQDFWRFWGIFRSVKLLCCPSSHMEDLHIQANMDGLLTASVTVSGCADRVVAELLSPEAQPVVTMDAPVTGGCARLETTVCNPLLWSAEHPHLYSLNLRLMQGETLVETCCQSVGFRTICIEEGILKLNGKRLVFHGVNRHEWNSQHGRIVTAEEMERDARLMKQNNINAVRTSHYPNRSEWYAICDRIGLYMIDEVNLETHGTWSGIRQKPGQELPHLPDGVPEWKQAVFDRAGSMFRRDKNHPSIVLWSCGNESGGGETLYEMSNLLRRWDSTRPVQYEGIIPDPRYPGTSDLHSVMYWPADRVEKQLLIQSDKPWIQVEYAHAMGNSCGSLDRYIALEERYPQYQGGFVWDWIDQQIQKDGVLHIGGDFRDHPNTGNFCADGLLFADGTPSPKLSAVKAAYRPCNIRFVRQGIELENKLLFTDLSQFLLHISVQTPNGEYTNETLSIPCPPLSKVVIPWTARLPETGEVWVNVSVRLKEDCPWAEAGHELAFAQHTLRTKAQADSGWTVIDGGEHLGIRTSGISVLFSKAKCRLCSLRVNGKEWLSTSPSAVFWRAPVSNDSASFWPFEKNMWKGAELYQKPEAFSVYESGSAVIVSTVVMLPTTPSIPCSIRYHFEKGQKIRVELDCMLPDGMETPFVFGAQFVSFAENGAIEYDGLGPDESAPDRLEGVWRSRWSFQAVNAVTPYMTPQACGLRCETRWFTSGGLKFEGETPFALRALPYTQHELENALHPFELPSSNKVVLQLLSDVCGVGGDNTWGARPQSDFCLSKKAYHLGFTISPASL